MLDAVTIVSASSPRFFKTCRVSIRYDDYKSNIKFKPKYLHHSTLIFPPKAIGYTSRRIPSISVPSCFVDDAYSLPILIEEIDQRDVTAVDSANRSTLGRYIPYQIEMARRYKYHVDIHSG